MTEQNVQLLPTNRKPTVGTSQVSIMSSAERARRYVNARAVFELAEARVAMLAAQDDMAACSQTGSAGRRLDDVRSDTGSSGPSPPTREQAQESPFAGVYSPPPTPTTTIAPTPTIYEVFSEQRGASMLDQILPTRGATASSAFHPPSCSGPSKSSGALLGAGLRLSSVASVFSVLAAPPGLLLVVTGFSRPVHLH